MGIAPQRRRIFHVGRNAVHRGAVGTHDTDQHDWRAIVR
jgi:hypothetical protein